MPKIAITADWHIDSYGSRINPETGRNRRLEDLARSARWVVHDAAERGCRILLFGGDLHRTARPEPGAILAAVNALLLELTCVAIAGNHDGARGSGGVTTVEVATRAGGGFNMSRPGIIHAGSTLYVACFPWPSEAWLAAKGVSPTPIAMRNLVAAALQNLAEEAQKFDGQTVLLAHLPLLEATTASERLMSLCGDWAISVNEIPETFAASFLGHIHRAQCLRESPPVWYCGGIDRLDFGEADLPVGYLIWDSETGAVEHIPNPQARQSVRIAYDLFEDAVEIRPGAMVRITCPSAKADEALAMAARLSAEIADIEVRVETVAESVVPRARSETISTEMALGDLIDEYLRARTIDVSAELASEAKQLAATLAAQLGGTNGRTMGG